MAPQEFSFPCSLASFLIFPGQLGLLFHTMFKTLKSYLKCVLTCHWDMLSQTPLYRALTFAHTPQPSFHGICTSHVSGDITAFLTNHSPTEFSCLPLLPALCWLPLYRSENRFLNFIVLLKSEIFLQYLQTTLLPRFHHDQEREEDATLVSFTWRSVWHAAKE